MKHGSSSARLSLVERKDLGAFYTPRAMTDFAAAWAVRDRRARVLDPGCGDAAFLVSAANRLHALGARDKDIATQLFGVDLNDDAVATAGRALEQAGVDGATLIQGNFFKIESDDLFETLKPVDAVIGNPPYIRYQLFRDDNRAAGLKSAARAGVILPQLTSSWAPYVVHASTFLQPGGRLALVLPGELLHVGYAAAVREFLLRTFSELTIVSFDDKVFPGALEEVVIVLGVKGPGDGQLRVRTLKSLEDLAAGPDAVLEKTYVSNLAPGERWLTALFEQGAIGAAREVVERAKYRPLGDLGRVDIGVVTGANDFFMVTKSQVAENKIPFSVLIPAVSKAVHVQGSRFSVLDWSAQAEAGDPAYLMVVDPENAKGSVAKYIEKGEAMGLPARYKCRTREPWYRVPYVKKPELFLTYMSHLSPRLAVNEAGAAHTNTVHGVFLFDELLAEPLAAAFLNSATLLSAEIEGRSYGGGVLKIEPGEAGRLLVPRLTPRLAENLCEALPKVDKLVREGHLDEASVAVDRIVLGKNFRRVEIEKIRSALSALRARRLGRARPGK